MKLSFLALMSYLVTLVIKSDFLLLTGIMFHFDFDIYGYIYQVPILYWYDLSAGYYYSPLFYFIFYPFHSFPFNFFPRIEFWIFSFWDQKYTFLKLEIVDSICLDGGYYLLVCISRRECGHNLIRYSHLHLESKKHPKLQGFIIGILLFKPSILIVVLFFLWQSKNRKQFLIFLSLGFTINYIAFLWYPGLIVPFIANLLFRYNELGLETFVGIHYFWLWAVIMLFISDLSKKNWQNPKLTQIMQFVG